MRARRARRASLRALLALLVGLQGGACAADERDFTGRVTKIFDGDSFLVRPASGRDIDVRLIDIDAPEKRQPYGPQARDALRALIGDRQVFVDVVAIDRYGRKLAHVYREPDRLDVIDVLLRDGHVWVYRTVRDPELERIQQTARSARLGLWALPPGERIPPWDFRRMHRKPRGDGARHAGSEIRR